jgi:fibronectin-binding autotransporter adhesin
MKSRSALHAFLFGCSSLLAISDVHAASLYWDGTDSTANADGGAGTWDTTATNWDSSAFGGSSATWNNTTPDSAVFSGTAGTVILGEAITVGGLRFDTNGYTMNSGTSGLSFGAADNTILLAGNANATITGAVGGTGNIILGPLPALGRTLTLNGTSGGGWSGLTTVNMGSTLALSASNQGLLNTSGIVVNGGGITLTNTGTEAALDRVSDTAPITANGGTIICVNPSDANTYAETWAP